MDAINNSVVNDYEGFIITGFFVSKIRKTLKEVVDGKENFYQL